MSTINEPRSTAAEREATTHGAIETRLVAADLYQIDIRDHQLYADQPLEAGGDDVGPTPVELLVASLASCVAFYAGRYLTRHGLSRHGLRVSADFTMSARPPARVAEIRLRLNVPPGLSGTDRARLLAVAQHCTVHNTLLRPPEIRFELTADQDWLAP